MSMGWPHGSTAATTVMLIASTGGRRESLSKGSMRVVGTLIGAAIGLCLVGLFAQDRFSYMLSVSIIVSFIFYLRKAYRADPTLFMLIGVVILMTSNGGDTDGAFLYGIDRAFMTAFGVVIYTLVSVFIFPFQAEKNLHQTVVKLNQLQSDIFSLLTANVSDKSENEESEQKSRSLTKKVKQLQQAQTLLETSYHNLSKECSDISSYRKEWDHLVFYCQKITEQLVLLVNEKQLSNESISSYLPEYEQATLNVTALFESLQKAWLEESDEILKEIKVEFEQPTVTISPLDKASAVMLSNAMNTLQEKLIRLSNTIKCIDSVTETISYSDFVPKKVSKFLLWDMENFKTAIKVFIMYWFSGMLWINFNPPGGYTFVIFSTMYMMLLSFLPVHPIMLLALFTFSFVIAIPSYVFILPHLTLGMELGIFIFAYTFIAFYVFKRPITILFMLGFFVMGISSPMHLNFAILLSTMTLFYLVVAMIFIFYYVPFSTKPEHLFCVVQERFFRHSSSILKLTKMSFPETLLSKLKLKISIETMNVSLKKLTLWESKLNKKYFNKTEQCRYDEFISSCDLLKNNMNSLVSYEAQFKDNELVRLAKKDFQELNMAQLIVLKIGEENSSNLHFQKYSQPYESIEAKLNAFFESIDLTQYSDKKVAEFYIFLNSQKNIYKSILQCQVAHDGIDWKHLQEKRF
ncbi:FUSC family protein [Vibrio rumoiensis]